MVLAVVGAYQLVTGWNLDVDEQDALVAATRAVGFPVGHASAQMGWRGLRSRPTWRILLYSAENPPTQRGLVLVDGVDGEIVEHFVEDNPEDWSDRCWRRRAAAATDEATRARDHHGGHHHHRRADDGGAGDHDHRPVDPAALPPRPGGGDPGALAERIGDAEAALRAPGGDRDRRRHRGAGPAGGLPAAG